MASLRTAPTAIIAHQSRAQNGTYPHTIVSILPDPYICLSLFLPHTCLCLAAGRLRHGT